MQIRTETDGRLFRANPVYELVVWDRLGEDERGMLGELRSDPQFYGILRPAEGSGRTMRAVDRDTALLFLTLQQPSPLPAFARSDGGASAVDLITDGVLEVFDGERFLAGGAGAALLMEGDAPKAGHRLGGISEEALQYAAALRLHDVHSLAARLYGYNRLPITPEWAARVPDARGVLRFLGVEDAGGWRVTASGGGAWLQWERRGRRPDAPPTHKLYVSPLPDALSDAFRRLLEVLDRSPVTQFKVGGDAAGLLRPDKLVLYFDDAPTLSNVADTLARVLADVPAHGVPFTAPIDDGAVLSWGMDPPTAARPLSWLPSESWRSWLVRELASALITQGGTTAPIGPALERLRRRGVDLERWVPASDFWRHTER